MHTLFAKNWAWCSRCCGLFSVVYHVLEDERPEILDTLSYSKIPRGIKIWWWWYIRLSGFVCTFKLPDSPFRNLTLRLLFETCHWCCAWNKVHSLCSRMWTCYIHYANYCTWQLGITEGRSSWPWSVLLWFRAWLFFSLKISLFGWSIARAFSRACSFDLILSIFGHKIGVLKSAALFLGKEWQVTNFKVMCFCRRRLIVLLYIGV